MKRMNLKKYERKTTMKKRMLCGFMSALMLVSAGCGAQAETGITIPEHVTKQLNDKLDVDAEAVTSLDLSGKLYSYRAEPVKMDGQKLQDVFFEAGEDVIIDETDGQVICCSSDDAKRAVWTASAFTSFARMEDIGYLTAIDAYGASTFPEALPTVEKLSFMTAEEAQKTVKETAEKLEIQLADKPYAFFALDEAALKALYDETAEELPKEAAEALPGVDFEGDKGCYYMLWQQLCPHGETMMSGNIGLDVTGFTFTMGTYVMAVVNEHGLANFRAGIQYDYTEENEIDGIIDVDAALDKVKELYKTVPLTEECHITRITLQYAAALEDREAGTYRIVPTWCMETSGDSGRIYVVDAVKGVIL